MTQNDTTFRSPKLTFRQEQALPILAAVPSLSEAARRSNVSLSTLRRWLDDPDFREELACARQEAAQLAQAELQGLMLQSVAVLSDAMLDDNPSIRIRAARTTLNFAVKIGELNRLREEVQTLKEALPLWAAHHSV